MNAKIAVELTLRGFQAFASGLRALGTGIGGIAQGVTMANTALAHLGQNWQQVVGMVKGVGRIGEGLIGPNAEIETMTRQYEGLTGSAEGAAAAVKLVMGDTIKGKLPFAVGEVNEAAKSLMAYGIRAGEVATNLDHITDPAERMLAAFRANLNAAPDLAGVLVRVQDAAAVAGKDLTGLAQKVGQFYYLTQQDLPFKDMLKEAFGGTGALSQEALTQLIAMSDAGGQGAQAWSLLMREFARHAGRAAEIGETWAGLGQVASNQFKSLRAQVGKPMFESMKGDLVKVVRLMGEVEDGSRASNWVGRVGSGLDRVYQDLRDHAMEFGENLLTSVERGGLGSALKEVVAASLIEGGKLVGKGIAAVGQEIGAQIMEGMKASIFGTGNNPVQSIFAGQDPKAAAAAAADSMKPWRGAGNFAAYQQMYTATRAADAPAAVQSQRQQLQHTEQLNRNLADAVTHSARLATNFAELANLPARL